MGSTSAYHCRHLVSHLLDHGRVDDACRLLLANASSGRHTFFQARDAAGDLPGLLGDVAATWRQLSAEASPRPALELKLALLYTTTRHIVAREPIAVIGLRLETLFWRREDALRFSYAQRDAARRAEALLAVAEVSPHSDNFAILRQALATLDAASGGAASTSHMYTALFRLMPEEGRTEVLADIIENNDRRALLEVLPVVADVDLGAAIAAGLDMFRAITPDSPAGRSIYGSAMLKEGETGTLEQQVLAEKAEGIGRLSEWADNRAELFDEARRYACGTEGNLLLQTEARLLANAPPTIRADLQMRLLDRGLRSDSGVRILTREIARLLDRASLLRLLERARLLADASEKVTAFSRLAPLLEPQQEAVVVAEALTCLEDAWSDDPRLIFAARALAANNGDRFNAEQMARFLRVIERAGESYFDLLLNLIRSTKGTVEPLVDAALALLMQPSREFDELAFVFSCRRLMGTEGYHFLDGAVRAADKISEHTSQLSGTVDRSLTARVWPSAERAVRRLHDGSASVLALSAIAAAMNPGPIRESAMNAAVALAETLNNQNALMLARAALLRAADEGQRVRLAQELEPCVSVPDGLYTEVLRLAIPFVGDDTRLRWAERAAQCVHDGGASRRICNRADHWMSLTAHLPPPERERAETTLVAAMGADGDRTGMNLDEVAACLPYLSDRRRSDLAIDVFKRRSQMRGPNRGLALFNALAAVPASPTETWPFTPERLAIAVRDQALDIKCGMCSASIVGSVSVHIDGLPFASVLQPATRIPRLDPRAGAELAGGAADRRAHSSRGARRLARRARESKDALTTTFSVVRERGRPRPEEGRRAGDPRRGL